MFTGLQTENFENVRLWQTDHTPVYKMSPISPLKTSWFWYDMYFQVGLCKNFSSVTYSQRIPDAMWLKAKV